MRAAAAAQPPAAAGARRPRRLLPLLLLALAAAAGRLPGAAAQTLESDKAALLAFKASLADDGGDLLAGWSEYSDPCVDSWRGVACTCFAFYESGESAERLPICTPLQDDSEGQRVLQLNLGDVRITEWNTVGGALPPALADLSALRILNLRGNGFAGPVPPELAALTNLEQLVLSRNNVSGPLPPFLSEFPRLKYVFLDGNSFEGALPGEWCLGAWWMFDVRGNAGLCDEAPQCLRERLVGFDGTSLIDPVSNDDRGQGGYCDVSPPTCRAAEDACIVLGPDPPFWPAADRVAFSFPAFPSLEGGAPAFYNWSLGTQPGLSDVVPWQPVSGEAVSRAAEVADPEGEAGARMVITQTVYLADEALPPGVALRQGQEYFVSVRGSNAGGPLQGAVVTSAGIRVDATPPFLPPGSAVFSSQFFANRPAQASISSLGVSWDPFEDPESGVKSYATQAFEYLPPPAEGSKKPNYTGLALTPQARVKDKSAFSMLLEDLDLTPGKQYFVRVTATNGVGAAAAADAPPVMAGVTESELYAAIGGRGGEENSGLPAARVVVIVAALAGAASGVVALVTFYLARERYRRRQQASRKLRAQERALLQLLASLAPGGKGGGGYGEGSGGSAAPSAAPSPSPLPSLAPTPDGADAKDAGAPADPPAASRDVALVITDLEGSTAIAAASDEAHAWVQEAHDSLVRDLIAAHGGYEVGTEGDAFHVSFPAVAAAVRFCMEVQYQLLEVDWPRMVLRLPECRAARAPGRGRASSAAAAAEWATRGPRVRMAVHWAEGGAVTAGTHTLTKRRVLGGAAFQATRDLCEAAAGGQVLLSLGAWARLRGAMPAAGFPVVEQLGAFRLAARPHEETWIYEVTQLLGRPPRRPFPGLAPAAAARTAPGAGLAVVPPPATATARGDLAFVALRLAAEACPAGRAALAAAGAAGEEGAEGGGKARRRRARNLNPLHALAAAGGAASSSSGAAAEEARLPPPLFRALHALTAATAQQFGGHVFRASEACGAHLLAFADVVDGLRFCHALQALALAWPWPPEAADWSGAEERGPDGRPLFRGPRLAAALHLSNNYAVRPVPRPQRGPEGEAPTAAAADYLGPGEEAARELAEVAHGGQVVLSEAAWTAAAPHLPGAPAVVSLGTHALLGGAALPSPAMLMEVLPGPLARRAFPPPRRARMIEPGYRDAPPGGAETAIAQLKLAKPREVAAAEAAGVGGGSEAAATLAEYGAGVARAVAAARALLRAHGGYECKEAEPGKLTLAFRRLEGAVRWGAALHRALLELPLPAAVEGWEGCAERWERDEEEAEREGEPLGGVGGTGGAGVDGAGGGFGSFALAAEAPRGALLWRGLTAHVGVAAGLPAAKAPLTTGRADYFGASPNLAARLAAAAHPGQTLVDGGALGALRGAAAWRGDAARLPGDAAAPEGVELTPVGAIALKGWPEARPAYQAAAAGLAGRAFDPPEGAVAGGGAGRASSLSSRLRLGGGGRRADAPPPGSADASVTAGGASGGGGGGGSPDGRAASLFQAGFFAGGFGGGYGGSGGGFGASGGRPSIFSTISRSGSGTAPAGPAGRALSASSASSGGARGGVWPPGWRGGAPASGGRAAPGGGAASDRGGSSAAATPRSVAAHHHPGAAALAPDGAALPAQQAQQQQQQAALARGASGGAPSAAGGWASLRDVSDWSYPASRAGTPSGLSAAAEPDAWEAGLAMEAALRSDGLPAGGGGAAGGAGARAPATGAADGGGGEGPTPRSAALEAVERGDGEGAGGGRAARQIAALFADLARKKRAAAARAAAAGGGGDAWGRTPSRMGGAPPR